MNRSWDGSRFESSFTESMEDGCGGYDLWCIRDGKRERVARVLFWDAMGHFFVETFGEVPLVILDEVVAEAKKMLED